MSWEIYFEHLPIGYSLAAAKSEETVPISIMEFSSTEDGDNFIRRLEGYPSEVLEKTKSGIQPSMISHMLVIMRPDKSATVYINELDISARVQPKRSVKAGEAVFTKDIADINSLKFKNIDIPNTCGVVFLFSVGWRKGLFFDFAPLQPKNAVLRNYDLERLLARQYTYLLFQERFKISEKTWEGLFKSGWFPFVSLSDDLLRAINNYAENDWEIDELLPRVFEETRILLEIWPEKWRRLPAFNSHIELLQRAIERFIAKDFISVVAILYPRIEGIMRIHHQNISPSTKATQETLIASALSKVSPEINPKLLLLPDKFERYLAEIYFANFDPSSPKGTSRHTVSHGVASPNDFSEKSACLAFLIIDQLSFYFA